MELYAGLAVHVSDNFDPDAADADFPLEGVVEGVVDGLVVVRHGDYVERVREDWFWGCYCPLA